MFNLQPILESKKIIAKPIQENDFDKLYEVASDPLVWEQHPNKDRYKKEVFKTFFEGALQSGGALKIIDKASDKVIGSTRFYDYNAEKSEVFIGYTFFSRAVWGKGYNADIKSLMLDYAFRWVDKVFFHIGAVNIRSQKSIEKIGALKVGEEKVAYYGEESKLNFVYLMSRQDWLKRLNNKTFTNSL